MLSSKNAQNRRISHSRRVLCTGVYGDGAEGDRRDLEGFGDTLKGGNGHRTEIEKAGRFGERKQSI